MKITKKEYLGLLIDSAELARLNAMGVDNWSGCEDAYDGWDEEKADIKAGVDAIDDEA